MLAAAGISLSTIRFRGKKSVDSATWLSPATACRLCSRCSEEGSSTIVASTGICPSPGPTSAITEVGFSSSNEGNVMSLEKEAARRPLAASTVKEVSFGREAFILSTTRLTSSSSSVSMSLSRSVRYRVSRSPPDSDE